MSTYHGFPVTLFADTHISGFSLLVFACGDYLWSELVMHSLLLCTTTSFALTTHSIWCCPQYTPTPLSYPSQWRDLDSLFTDRQPSLTTLVPSYKEEYRVIEQTLLSATLQSYGFRRVVLLIDNPPNPTNAEDIKLLAGGSLFLLVYTLFLHIICSAISFENS